VGLRASCTGHAACGRSSAATTSPSVAYVPSLFELMSHVPSPWAPLACHLSQDKTHVRCCGELGFKSVPLASPRRGARTMHPHVGRQYV